MSLETICLLKSFLLYYCSEKNAKSRVKHFVFLQKIVVLGVIRGRLRASGEVRSFDSEVGHFLCQRHRHDAIYVA